MSLPIIVIIIPMRVPVLLMLRIIGTERFDITIDPSPVLFRLLYRRVLSLCILERFTAITRTSFGI